MRRDVVMIPELAACPVAEQRTLWESEGRKRGAGTMRRAKSRLRNNLKQESLALNYCVRGQSDVVEHPENCHVYF